MLTSKVGCFVCRKSIFPQVACGAFSSRWRVHPLARALALALLGAGLSTELHAAITYSGDVSNAGSQNAQLWDLGSIALDVGSASNAGTVTVSGNGLIQLTPSGSLDLGRVATSMGTLEVSGSSARVNVGSNIDVGDYGNGVLRITNGGQVNASQAYIGRLAGSQGDALVSGAGSTLTTSSFLFIGNNGLGILRVEDAGQVLANGIIDVGRNTSATAGEPADAALITGAGSLLSTTRSLNVGRNNGSDGVLTVTNQAQARSQEGYVGRAAGSKGVVNISAAGQWLLDEQLSIGNAGQGQLVIESAGRVSSASAYVAQQAGSSGQVSVSGVGSQWNINEQLLIGVLANASVSATGAAQVNTGSAVIGQGAGVSATAQLSGAGTQWTNSGDLLVGSFGGGTLTLEQGARLNTQQLSLAVQAGSSADVRIQSGSVVQTAQIVQGAGAAQLAFDGATLQAIKDQPEYLSGVSSALIGTAGLVVDDNGYSLGLSTAFSGGGGFTKQGSGALSLKTANSYTGPTQITSGTLYALSDNALGSGAVSVAGAGSAAQLNLQNVSLANAISVGTQGELYGIGSVGSTVLQRGAIIAPGFGDSQIGTLNINGDLIFTTGSEYDVFLDIETGDSDRLVVSGVADLNAAQLRYKGIGDSYERGSWYEILSAARRDGQFAEVVSDYPFLDVLTNYDLDPNKVFIGLRRKVGVVFSDLAFTPNQKATARALEQINDADLLDEFIETLPAGEPARMYDFLSGEIHASLRSTLQGWDALVSQASLQPLSRALALCNNSKMPDLWEQYHCSSEQQWPIWVQALGNWEQRRSDGNAAKGQSHAGGLMIGSGAELGQSGWHVGARVAAGHSDLNVDQRNSSAKISHYSAALVAGKGFVVGQDQLKLSTFLSYGHHQIKTERFVPRVDQTLKAEYHGHNLQLSGEASYVFARFNPWQLEPYARLMLDRQRVGSFSEKGGFAGVSAESDSRTHTHSQLGLRGAYRYAFAGRPIEVGADLGWRRAWNHRDVTRTMAFNVGSPDFTIAGVDLPRDALAANVQGQWFISEQASVALNVGAAWGSHLRQHNGQLSLKYDF